MTEDEMATAKRRMLINVPFPGEAGQGHSVIVPVSFSIRDFGASGVTLRLVDEVGQTFDLDLNPVLAQSLSESIALATHIRSGQG